MISSKYFSIQGGIDNTAHFMAPYMALKLGLVDAVCLPIDDFNRHAIAFRNSASPLYQDLLSSLFSVELSKVFDAVPRGMEQDVLTLRSRDEYQVFMLNFQNTLDNFHFATANNFKLAMDVETGGDLATASTFYASITENIDEPTFEYYKYSGIGTQPLRATSLKGAIAAIENLYENQCREIVKSGAAYEIDPEVILDFSATVEKQIIDKTTGTLSTDPSEQLTLTPNTFLSEEEYF